MYFSNKYKIFISISFFLGSLSQTKILLANEFKEGYKKQKESQLKKFEECNQKYEKAQWASSYQRMNYSKKEDISSSLLDRIYIDKKGQIYEMSKQSIGSNCHIFGVNYTWVTAINKSNPKPRKLNKEFTETITTGLKIGFITHLFTVEGNELILYSNFGTKKDPYIKRHVWATKTTFRDPNYNSSFSEPKFSVSGFGEFPIKKGNYLICSNGSEISSKVFIPGSVVDARPQMIRKTKRVKNPNYNPLGLNGFEPMYLEEEEITFKENLPYNKNDKNQITSFPTDNYTGLFNAKSYGNKLLYGIKSKIIPTNLDGIINSSGSITNNNKLNGLANNLLSSQLSEKQYPLIFKSYDIRRKGFYSWDYKYLGENKKNSQSIEARIEGDELFLSNSKINYIRNVSNSFGSVYCLNEPNKFLLRVVDFRKTPPIKDKYGQNQALPDFIKLTNYYFNVER